MVDGREVEALRSGVVAEMAAMIATAAEGNDYFESDREVSARLLNDLHTQLQVIVDLKLLRPLGEGMDSARPRRADILKLFMKSMDQVSE